MLLLSLAVFCQAVQANCCCRDGGGGVPLDVRYLVTPPFCFAIFISLCVLQYMHGYNFLHCHVLNSPPLWGQGRINYTHIHSRQCDMGFLYVLLLGEKLKWLSSPISRLGLPCQQCKSAILVFFSITFCDCGIYAYSYAGISVMYVCIYLEDVWAMGDTFWIRRCPPQCLHSCRSWIEFGATVGVSWFHYRR